MVLQPWFIYLLSGLKYITMLMVGFGVMKFLTRTIRDYQYIPVHVALIMPLSATYYSCLTSMDLSRGVHQVTCIYKSCHCPPELLTTPFVSFDSVSAKNGLLTPVTPCRLQEKIKLHCLRTLTLAATFQTGNGRELLQSSF